MKLVLRNLAIGVEMRGEVREVLSATELIISFYGDLLRVQNETRQEMKLGAMVRVRVQAVEPLRLQLLTDTRRGRRFGHLDVSV